MWIENSFAEFPKSRLLPDGSGILVTGRYLEPQWEGYVFVIGLLLCGLYFYTHGEQVITFLDFLKPALACFLIAIPLGWLWGHKRVDVKFRHDTIGFGWSAYSRKAPIEFRIDDHHKTFNPPYKPIYNSMCEVVMQYGERRVILATMSRRDIFKAQALMLRLAALHADLNGFMNANGASEEEVGEPGGPYGPKPDIS